MINEKLVYVTAAYQNISTLHRDLRRFMEDLRVNLVKPHIEQRPPPEMNDLFVRHVDNVTFRAIKQIDKFDYIFKYFEQAPVVSAGISSEASRLSEFKSCEFHRAKLEQFQAELNSILKENL